MAFDMILDRSVKEFLVGWVDLVIVFRVHDVEVGNPLLFVKHCIWVVDFRVARKARWIIEIRIFELLRLVETILS